MKPKTKALIFNFIAFMLIFLVFRLTLGSFLKMNTIWLGLISAVITSVITPKFAVVKKDGKEKILMKNFFSKDLKEL